MYLLIANVFIQSVTCFLSLLMVAYAMQKITFT